MAATPQTVYARDGDVNLAYQVVGDSGHDLLFVPTPRLFGRLTLTDLLGAGGSDGMAPAGS
ncbi:hypothetical protein [Mycobacterium sp. pR1184]|uniref:hypothetical protein n=1 Tax=Mycobacterium sp. pR1184 TaxID=3238981 RepID=UPI00351B8527